MHRGRAPHWRKYALIVLTMVLAMTVLEVAPASARAGAANWSDLNEREEGCTISLRLPVVDPYNRIYDWNCGLMFDVTGSECFLVDATVLSVTGCQARLGLSFTGVATRTKTDDGHTAWQCTGAQTNAYFYFYDGYSGRAFESWNTQVEVKAGQADVVPPVDAEGPVPTVSEGSYNGSLIYNGGFGTLNYYGAFLLDCNRAFTGEGYAFEGQLLLEEAP